MPAWFEEYLRRVDDRDKNMPIVNTVMKNSWECRSGRRCNDSEATTLNFELIQPLLRCQKRKRFPLLLAAWGCFIGGKETESWPFVENGKFCRLPSPYREFHLPSPLVAVMTCELSRIWVG